MRRKLAVAVFIMLICLLASLPAMAADIFRFTDAAVTVYTGETVTPELIQDGKYLEGDVVWSVAGNKCSVDEEGNITGIAPGQSTVSAALKQNGKTVRSVKIYADGALGSRGAKLLEPYSDDPENTGLILESDEFYRHVCQKAYDAGYQVCCHAIGDGGVHHILDIYSEFLKGKNDLRWRIEHSQVVDEDDF